MWIWTLRLRFVLSGAGLEAMDGRCRSGFAVIVAARVKPFPF